MRTIVSCGIMAVLVSFRSVVVAGDSTLTVYWLTPELEAQFVAQDSTISEFWGAWTARDYIDLNTTTNPRPGQSSWTDTGDARVTVKAAAGERGLYLLFSIEDNYWLPHTSGDTRFDGLVFYLDIIDAATIASCSDCLIGLYNSGLTYSMHYLWLWVGDSVPATYFAEYFYDPQIWCAPVGWLVPIDSSTQRRSGMALDVVFGESQRQIEWFFPWSTVGGPFAPALSGVPASGQRLAFAVEYRDMDAVDDSVNVLSWVGAGPWGDSREGRGWGDLEMGAGFPPASGVRSYSPRSSVQRSQSVTYDQYRIDGRRLSNRAKSPHGVSIARAKQPDGTVVSSIVVTLSSVQTRTGLHFQTRSASPTKSSYASGSKSATPSLPKAMCGPSP